MMPGVRRLAHLLLRSVRFPQYVAVGVREPQDWIRVWLHGLGTPLDVTTNHVVAALRPLTIGIMLRRGDNVPEQLERTFALDFRDAANDLLLGTIHLRARQDLPLGEHYFVLFEPIGCANHCLSPARLRMYYAYEAWRSHRRQRANPYNFQMTNSDLRSLFVFYTCPRPVVLVTAAHQNASNIFPMDLIGPTDSQWYSLALRSTSPAVRVMQESRRAVLATIPRGFKSIAYQLGGQHGKTDVDWGALPFATEPSPAYGLPVPAAALRVREVTIHEYHSIGSHTLFLTTIENVTVNDRTDDSDDSLSLCHIHGAYHEYLRDRGDRFAER